MDKACIFHHPFPLIPGGDSGSKVRPYKMLSAFKAIGYDVEVVSGFAAERKRSIQAITQQMNKGRKFAFAYSESVTIPTPLTEPHHLPTHPLLDFEFLRFVRKKAPVGLYYRDIHWRFNQYRHLPWYKRVVSVPFYHYDWYYYQRAIDHLFIPSKGMAQHLPSPHFSDNLSVLPPGSSVQDVAGTRASRDHLSLFYVGGVTPPLYDLTPLFGFTQRLDDIKLTICCREEEWINTQANYKHKDATVVHLASNDLRSYYARADLFVMLWQSHPYLDFAMPVKTFEAMAHGVPIVTTSGTGVAHFVEAEGIGWAVDSKEAFLSLINRLREHPEELERKREHVRSKRHEHTWQARAKQVAETLESYKR